MMAQYDDVSSRLHHLPLWIAPSATPICCMQEKGKKLEHGSIIISAIHLLGCKVPLVSIRNNSDLFLFSSRYLV